MLFFQRAPKRRERKKEERKKKKREKKKRKKMNETELYTQFTEYVLNNISKTFVLFKWIVKLVDFTAPIVLFLTTEIEKINQVGWYYMNSIITGIFISLVVLLFLVIKSFINTASIVIKYGLILVVSIIIGYFVIQSINKK